MIGSSGPFVILGSHEPLRRHERPSFLVLGAAWTPEEARDRKDSYKADTRANGSKVYADVIWTDMASAEIDAEEGYVDSWELPKLVEPPEGPRALLFPLGKGVFYATPEGLENAALGVDVHDQSTILDAARFHGLPNTWAEKVQQKATEFAKMRKETGKPK